MSDIVDRLNDKASGAHRFDGVPKWKLEFAAASAEIQRLRLELKSANELLRWSGQTRNDALEEAAKVADQVDRENKNHDLRWGAQRIAERIRALKEPKSLTAIEWHKVSGRGHIAVVEYDAARDVRVNDQVKIDGHEYTVTGIEARGNAPLGLLIRGERKDGEAT